MKKKFFLLMTAIVCTINAVAQNYKFGKVSKEELREKFYPLDSTAEAAYLYKNEYVTFNYNQQQGIFEKTIEFHARIKIYNKDGFKYGNQAIHFYNPDNGSSERIYRIKATTYNLKGKKIDEQDVDKDDIYTEKATKYYSYRKIAFPNIKEGSIIELKYTLISKYWDIPLFRVQEDVPIKKIMYTTVVPEYFKFKKSTKGYYSITPKVEWLNDNITLTSVSGAAYFTSDVNHNVISYQKEKTSFESENIPALKDDEPYTSNYADYRGVVSHELDYIRFPNSPLKKYSSSWESVCNKLHESQNFGKQLEKTSYFKDDLKTVLEGNDTEVEKMNAIFSFVKSKIRWNNYYSLYTNQGLRKAYKTGEGNISEVNLLLVSMLRASGLKAYPILLSTKSNGTPLFPTLEGLNYVIAGVKNEQGKILLLDASEPYNAVNVLPTRALNWEGRMMIGDRENIAIPLIPKVKSEELSMVSVVFDENFNITGSIQTKLTRKKALDFREKYNRLSDEKLKSKLGSKYGVSISSCEITNKNKVSAPVVFSGKLIANNQIETINGKKYINPLLFLKETTNPFKLEKRKYPVDFVTPYKEVINVFFNIPKGYKVVSMPTSSKAVMSNNLGSYMYLINQMGNRISIMFVKEFSTNIIGVNQYDELRGLYRAMISKNKEKIVLEKIVL
ncbi:DUF3857 domain-containing protein [Wenyingzhuangia sp. 2_MG-2023]|uniref:DUF3857 domain-containing protein n=1 Tax=Wenyingzhuangia sp. 2_MG-2023 TaxID=3062639 RepID=UPI0026E16E51|nr:DUF3857 domain-containing protein [Wenyingzhuangia sp. 2_MG-2023]MDO6736789.1 DUF3857 domain-containing protein [Wenyingzhuangia sp. 2_MG-2023]